jgi:predicted site-specific integrase-resolvase
MTSSHPADRPGMTYEQAKALLRERGLERSIRTLQRWVSQGILSVKRITSGTVILFRDEVEALITPEDPTEQRIESAKSAHHRRK